MNRFRRLLLMIVAAGLSATAFGQFDESGIAAGFFDSSNEKDINFSEFHLPPYLKTPNQVHKLYLWKRRVYWLKQKLPNKKDIFSRM